MTKPTMEQRLRLQDRINEVKKTPEWDGAGSDAEDKLDEAIAIIDELRKTIEDPERGMEKQVNSLAAQVVKLKAENERLKAILDKLPKSWVGVRDE